MRVLFAACGALLLSVFLLLAGSGLLFGLLPLRARIEGFSDASLGLLGSAYFVGMLLGCIAAPRLIRSAGHIRAYAACAALSTVMPLGHVLLSEPVAWSLMRMSQGFCLAVAYAIIESWLNERATNKTRGMVLAVYNIINFGAMAFGQQLMRLYAIEGFELFALAAILISLAAIPVALTRTMAPTPPERLQLRPMWLYKVSPVAFVACLGVGLANSTFWSLSPVFVTARGYDAVGVADFFSAAIIGGVISLFPFGRLSDMMDRRIVMGGCAAASVAAGLLLALLPIGDASYWALMGLGVFFGFAAMPIFALAGAQANDHTEPGDMVEVATGLILIYTIGAVGGPFLASLAVEQIGANAIFLFTAASHALIAVFAAWRMTRRQAVESEDRDNAYIAAPHNSPVAAEMSVQHYLEDDEEGATGM